MAQKQAEISSLKNAVYNIVIFEWSYKLLTIQRHLVTISKFLFNSPKSWAKTDVQIQLVKWRRKQNLLG